MYTSLQNAGFKPAQVEQAMGAIVQHGGDFFDAMDWLCLNVANGEKFFMVDYIS